MPRSRVLCVEDHQAGLRTLTNVLEHSGFDVVATANPQSVPALADAPEIDAVILDFQLPDTNGVLLAQDIKRQNPALPIILITAYPADVPENAANWIDAFLCKGHRTARELPAVVVALIRGRKKMSREETLVTLREAAKNALEMDQKFASKLNSHQDG